ncbi:MAG: di-trans,poly-cis-decaprenylcistransferase [Opitutaceae bacterium]|nr:di-trans,poly-cis-decaprenylcistransferase [Opitutaceae bacterium]|tara:strand:- start:2138 stop:2857 length:720 start_codon:yes stop_codon:yes gene_type:complete
MDGNGRWANRRGLTRNEGHQRGVENVEKIVEKAGQLGIRYLTLYAFSAENWKRPQSEVDALMKLLKSFLKKQQKHLLENEIRLHTIGRVEELPHSVFRQLKIVKEATKHFAKNHLILALNYGARNEIIDAVKRYTEAFQSGAENLGDLHWGILSQYLDTSELPDPQLVIRTSGEHRISNFLLLQSAYAEYVFSPVCWPDFSPDLLETAIEDYRNRERRFGKTGEQVRQEQDVSLKSTAQ